MDLDAMPEGLPAGQSVILSEFNPAHFNGESIDLYINSTCNLKCRTCFLGEQYFASVNDMPLKTAAEILRWANRAGVRDVAFLGGEPSLHPQVRELLELSRATGIPANRFISNGTKPFQRLLASSASRYIDLAYISLDGATEASNDSVRGNGVFKQARQSMDLLVDCGIPFVITASITPASYHEIDALLELAERSGCCTLNIHWVSPTGRARDQKSSVTPSDWIRLCNRVMEYKVQRPGFTIQCQAAYSGTLLARPIKHLDETVCAVRQRTNLQFMPSGAVYACGLLTDRIGLNGYQWTGYSLAVRTGATELSLCDATIRPGCPVRREIMTEPGDEDSNFTPLCIYQRVFNAAD